MIGTGKHYNIILVNECLSNSSPYYKLMLFIRSSSDLPDAPDRPAISDVDRHEMTVSWKAPKSDGGAVIKQYILERKDKYSTRWVMETKTTSLEYRVTGLTQGTEYQFRVSAENKAGVGPASPPTTPTEAKPPFGKF